MDRFIEREGTRIWTTSSGQGVPTIFCNGGPGCDDYLGPVAEMIEDICHVVRFEPRGCGRSEYDGRYELETTIEDIDFIRREYGFQQVILLGHSAGPDVALAYTMQWPEYVKGVIGIAGGRIVDDRDWHAKYRENVQTMGDPRPGEFIADPDVNRIGNLTWKEYIKRAGLLSDIAAIECPVTFINAGRDPRPNWPTRQLANLIPKGQYFEIADAQHCPWMTHADALKEYIRDAIVVMANPARSH